MADTRSSVTRPQVGTSGFSYPSWRGAFYPREARADDFLRLYAERLPAVELNTTFYRLPSEEQFARWAAATPPEFRFAVKLSRRITHFGRLELISTFCERVQALGERLGPILVQLPPTRPRDDGLLRFLLDSLDPALRYAFEFRHESWAGVDETLFDAGATRVGSLSPEAPFVYLRLREPPYDDAALSAWAERLRPILLRGAEAFCFFKHEDEPTAPCYACRLLELLKYSGTS
ncbi:MAG: DUF72 domain-containing protein [Actinobacteria bacterium]|nr:DUF72 domain-containing protein [Actinomycetota bacterium]